MTASPSDIRRWAADQGYAVGTRGRLSPDVIQAYTEAHGGPPAVEAPQGPEREQKYEALPMVTPGVAESFTGQEGEVARAYTGEEDLTDEMIAQAKEERSAIVVTGGGKLRVHRGGDVPAGVSVLLDWRER